MASSGPRFSDVSYASFFIYPARPTTGRQRTDVEDRAKAFVIGVKQLRVNPRFTPPDLVEWSIDQMKAAMPGTVLQSFFGAGRASVIAAPGAGLTLKNSVSAPQALCQALYRSELVAKVLPRIMRTKAVTKSAFAPAGQRTTLLGHYESMAVEERGLNAGDDIIVVDDVVTKGATLLAAAARVREAYPDARVRVFALARTSDIIGTRVREPMVGRIYEYFNSARRDPW